MSLPGTDYTSTVGNGSDEPSCYGVTTGQILVDGTLKSNTPAREQLTSDPNRYGLAESEKRKRFRLDYVPQELQSGLASITKTVAEEVIKIRDIVDFCGGLFEIVWHALEADDVIAIIFAIFQDHVRRTVVSVPRLANRTDIHQSLFAGGAVSHFDFFRREEIIVLRKDTRNVRMPLKTVLSNQAENAFHFPLVVNVLWEHVLIERVSRGTVDEQQVVLAVHTWKFAKKIPAFPVSTGVTAFEHLAGPENGPLRPGVEAFGVEQRSLIVIAQQRHLAIHHTINALARIRTVPDNVAEAIDRIAILLFDVREDGFQPFQVAVNVANDRSFQRLLAPRVGTRILSLPQWTPRQCIHYVFGWSRPWGGDLTRQHTV